MLHLKPCANASLLAWVSHVMRSMRAFVDATAHIDPHGGQPSVHHFTILCCFILSRQDHDATQNGIT